MSPVLQDASLGIRTEVLSHLLSMLQRTEVIDEPFTHCYFEQVFPESLYAELLAGLPAGHYLGGRAKSDDGGYSTRHIFHLNPDRLAVLSEPQRGLWSGVKSALGAPEFQTALFEKLSVGLARRFGIRREQAAEIEAYPRGGLYRDLPGYEIAPHPDTRKKFVTMQFFLPPDDSRPYLGTCLYRRLNSLRGLFSRQGRFERFKQFPFHANSGYAFVVSNSPLRPKSWHGCEKTPSGGDVRDTLLHIYYSDPA